MKLKELKNGDKFMFAKEDVLKEASIAGAKWRADHAPLPEDTVLFNKGVEEGKRLMMEEAVQGKIIYLLNGDVAINIGDTDKYNLGDKVRVIVLPKEDEK